MSARLLVVTAVMVVTVVGCSDDDDAGLEFDDIGDGTETTTELIDGIASFIDGTPPESGDEVSASTFALYRATIELYENSAMRSAIVQQALDNEDVTTRPDMATFGFNNDFIDGVFDDLRGDVGELPVDTFLSLPSVVTYIEQLQTALAPLGS